MQSWLTESVNERHRPSEDAANRSAVQTRRAAKIRPDAKTRRDGKNHTQRRMSRVGSPKSRMGSPTSLTGRRRAMTIDVAWGRFSMLHRKQVPLAHESSWQKSVRVFE